MLSHAMQLGLKTQIFDRFGRLKSENLSKSFSNTATITISVIDKNGIEVKRRTYPMRSFVYNWTRLAWGQFKYVSVANIPYVGGGGATYQSYFWGVTPVCNAIYGWYTRGMVVGTGTTPVTVNDYEIETLIPHGTGSGQLTYNAETIAYPTHTVDRAHLKVTRTFSNLSGATITVNEIALYSQDIESTPDRTVMIARDVLEESVGVANGSTLKVTYDFYVNKSSGFVLNYLIGYWGGFNEYTANFTYTQTDGATSASTTWADYPYNSNAAIGDEDKGILIGTSNQALNIEDYNLAAQNTTMDHQIQEFIPISEDGTYMQFNMARNFDNNTGSPIIIQEAALVSKGRSSSGTEMMLARALTGALTVADTETLRITFELITRV